MNVGTRREQISRKRRFEEAQIANQSDHDRISLSTFKSQTHISVGHSSYQNSNAKKQCLVYHPEPSVSDMNLDCIAESEDRCVKELCGIQASTVFTDLAGQNHSNTFQESSTDSYSGSSILSRRASMRKEKHPSASESKGLNIPRLNFQSNTTNANLNQILQSKLCNDHSSIHTKISGLTKPSSCVPILHETPLPISTQCKEIPTRMLLKHEEVIHDYIIFGSGVCAKAINTKSKKVFIAMTYRREEALKIMKIMHRLDNASKWYHEADCRELSNCILHPKSELVQHSENRFIMFVPSERETVHTYAAERADNITEQEVIHIFKQVVKIVNFCHTIGIVVRDMKPRKLLMYMEDGIRKIRLANVHGIVLLEDRLNDQIRERFVSPAYVPPEVLTLDRNAETYSGFAADMWGMGVLLYMLFIGKYPFYDATPAGVFRKIKRAKIGLPICHISLKSRNLISSLLKKDPLERTTTKILCDGYLYPETNYRCRIKEEIEYYEKRDNVSMLFAILEKTHLSEEERSSPRYELQRRRDLLLNVPLKQQLMTKVKELRALKKALIPQTMEIAEEIRQNIILGPWSSVMKKFARRRLKDINSLLCRDQKDVRANGRTSLVPYPNYQLFATDVPLELLFPVEIYPPCRNYNPHDDPLDSRIYNLLRENNLLNFPPIRFQFRDYSFDDIYFPDIRTKLEVPGNVNKLESSSEKVELTEYESKSEENH